MKHFLIISVLALCISCQNHQTITDKKDYQTYLENIDNRNLEQSEKAISFWSKRITQDSSQIIELGKVAGAYTGVFQATGDIESLKKAEQSLQKAVQKAAIGKDGYQRALAQNYITQHRFKEARDMVNQAREFGGDKKETNFLEFDVAMELGNYDKANNILEVESDFSNYNYLIRRAKWEDYAGNLSSTIDYMEKAKAIAESGKQKELMLWVYTNLADYYGHAGRISDSYDHYLRALDLDPSNAYAKKGIAWIAYAHDNNPQEALRIIDIIHHEKESPDYHLLKAEIEEFLGNTIESEKQIQKFLSKVRNPAYGEMYNTYLIELLASTDESTQEAVHIAQAEIKNRATPETYDLLAFAYLKNGEAERALELQEDKVIGKTFEPIANLHTAQIYKALGKMSLVKPLKQELLESGFELGPVTLRTVESL